MTPKDVSVIDFHFYPGIKGPEVKAMAQFTYEQTHSPQIVTVDLTEEEVQYVVAIARMVENRLLSGESPIPETEPPKRSMGFRTNDEGLEG
jgi:hypothetical protein